MIDELNPDKEQFSNDELEFDKALRPQDFSDFSGQPKVVENLKFLSVPPRYVRKR